MKRFLLAATVLFLWIFPEKSYADQDNDVKNILTSAFRSVDDNNDGIITLDEVQLFSDRAFSAMDINSTGQVNAEDFRIFSLGLSHLADLSGKSENYMKAREETFHRWDRDKKGSLDKETFFNETLSEFMKANNVSTAADLKLSLDQFPNTLFIKEMIESMR